MLLHFLPLLPALLMIAAATLALSPYAWRALGGLSLLALAATLMLVCLPPMAMPGWLATSRFAGVCAVLVQLVGTVVAAFSARYLAGEAGQRGYVAALAGALASVHLLLLADHWLILIAAWSGIGACLRRLLCFYSRRPFALLAAHKKQLADRLADALLLAAAALAWHACGSGALTALWLHLARAGIDASLQLSAICLALAVVLRTGLLPLHGWLTQVMEAPTPVSALLHAGVVNLGGFVLIRFAPLFDAAPAARALLLACGLATAVLAGLVMLTRVSIKLRLAWSTIAQMGFMVMECALGIYTLAALHLLGHSLYKAHAFLAAGSAVRQTRLRTLLDIAPPAVISTALAPVAAVAMMLGARELGGGAWPWWWAAILGLAWAPLLWFEGAGRWRQAVTGAAQILVLGGLALAAHLLPLGLQDRPDATLGALALAGMAALYLVQTLIVLERRSALLQRWRRWAYAGFYADDIATRLVLRPWPGRWMPAHGPGHPSPVQGDPA